MAANYLDVQQQLEDVRNYNKELEDQLEASEIEMNKVAAETDSEEGKKFVQLQKEKVMPIFYKEYFLTFSACFNFFFPIRILIVLIC